MRYVLTAAALQLLQSHAESQADFPESIPVENDDYEAAGKNEGSSYIEQVQHPKFRFNHEREQTQQERDQAQLNQFLKNTEDAGSDYDLTSHGRVDNSPSRRENFLAGQTHMVGESRKRRMRSGFMQKADVSGSRREASARNHENHEKYKKHEKYEKLGKKGM